MHVYASVRERKDMHAFSYKHIPTYLCRCAHIHIFFQAAGSPAMEIK